MRRGASIVSGGTSVLLPTIQQADVLAQMRQLYGKTLGLIGLDAMFLRL